MKMNGDSKSLIRREMRERRGRIAARVRAAASRDVCLQLMAREDIRRLAAGATVAIYCATAAELDLEFFAERLRGRGIRIAVPRWNGSDYELAELGATLASGPMGVPEPPPDARRIAGAEVSAWIVPGLAFTTKGLRLGYGGGWYDRLLAGARADAAILGVAYGFQMVTDLPQEPHDRRLSGVVVARIADEEPSTDETPVVPPCRVIDTHVHVYPDAIAAKVAAKIGKDFDVSHPERLMATGIVKAQRRAGIDFSLNLPIATSPKQVESINASVKSLPEGLRSFGTLHPDTPDIPSVLRELKAQGFRGLKFHPEFQNFTLDDPRMASCWEEMRSLGLVAYFHAGGDRSFFAPFKTNPRAFRDFVRKHPGLRVVAAHLGGFQMWDEVEECLCGEDLYFDLSHTMGFTSDEQIVRLIRRHGVARILFATDSPWREPADELRHFLRLPFSPEERELILHRNAEALIDGDSAGVGEK